MNSAGWFGEGKELFYVDGQEQPLLYGTGTDNYFGDAWGFHRSNSYYYGVSIWEGFDADDHGTAYRWHIPDPVRFGKRLKVTMQALGWRSGRRYLPLQDDIASVAYWYQSEPSDALPPLPEADALEVI